MSDLPAVKTSSAAALLQAGAKEVETTSAGGGFLKFDSKRTGDWLFGASGDIVTDDIVAIDTLSLKHGQILWHNKKPNRKMVPISAPLPEPQESITYTDAKGKEQTDEANEARSFEFSFADGGTGSFEASTYGGRKAVDSLLTELFARAAQGSVFLYPQVKLASDSYDHSSYGKVFEPVLEAVAWFDENGTPEDGAPAQLEAAPEQDSFEAVEETAPAEPTRRKRRTA